MYQAGSAEDESDKEQNDRTSGRHEASGACSGDEDDQVRADSIDITARCTEYRNCLRYGADGVELTKFGGDDVSKHLEEGIDQRGEVVDSEAPKGPYHEDYESLGRDITDTMFSNVSTGYQAPSTRPLQDRSTFQGLQAGG